jgi:CRISPR/Cas system-associated exonuclease Cas4 (RecB family)
MKEYLASKLVFFLYEISSLDSKLVLLAMMIVMSVIVLDGVYSGVFHSTEETGIRPEISKDVSIEGSKSFPGKNYVSTQQGLAGKPDAIIEEHGYLIPVEIKPLAKKMRDRYIAQLLVYMRLVEEFEQKKPPYGYLILGKDSRKVRVDNTEARQRWLEEKLQAMRMIIANQKEAIAEPHPHKCANCLVKDSCIYNTELGNDERPIHSQHSVTHRSKQKQNNKPLVDS